MNIETQNFGEITLINFTELDENDLRFVLKMRNHPEIKKWMYNQNDITEEQHLDFVEMLRSNQQMKYFIVRQNENIIGSINFTNFNYLHSEADFGLYANPFLSITGAGRILEETAISYAKNLLELIYLNLEVFEENKKVINLHKKYGFTKVGAKTINNQPVLCMQKIISGSQV
jgi:UDP-4-amino-4,6-dideoxy-N-acetyl-beta-L-altrosamine N-acetyltransferase